MSIPPSSDQSDESSVPVISEPIMGGNDDIMLAAAYCALVFGTIVTAGVAGLMAAPRGEGAFLATGAFILIGGKLTKRLRQPLVFAAALTTATACGLYSDYESRDFFSGFRVETITVSCPEKYRGQSFSASGLHGGTINLVCGS